MSEEIIKILDNLGEKFGIAIDWTSQNITPYLQNLLKRFLIYKNSIAIIQIVISIILIVVGNVCITKLIKWKEKDEMYDEMYDEELLVFGVLGSIVIIVIGVGLMIGNIVGIIQNICMPELTILKYIQGLI